MCVCVCVRVCVAAQIRVCKQIYYILVLLTSGRALDKVQGAGEGEGAEAWRSMHKQWEPISRSRFTALLLALLSKKFQADAQQDIEAFDRDTRTFESQSEHEIPDFIKAGIVINGVQEPSLNDPLIMHSGRLDTYEKIKQEVCDFARAEAALAVPMEVDALWKSKGKGKGDKGKKGKPRGK